MYQKPKLENRFLYQKFEDLFGLRSVWGLFHENSHNFGPKKI